MQRSLFGLRCASAPFMVPSGPVEGSAVLITYQRRPFSKKGRRISFKRGRRRCRPEIWAWRAR